MARRSRSRRIARKLRRGKFSRTQAQALRKSTGGRGRRSLNRQLARPLQEQLGGAGLGKPQQALDRASFLNQQQASSPFAGLFGAAAGGGDGNFFAGAPQQFAGPPQQFGPPQQQLGAPAGLIGQQGVGPGFGQQGAFPQQGRPPQIAPDMNQLMQQMFGGQPGLGGAAFMQQQPFQQQRPAQPGQPGAFNLFGGF